jgi:hypothetical protein
MGMPLLEATSLLRGSSTRFRIGVGTTRGSRGSTMKRMRGRLLRAALLWTLAMVVIAVLLAVQATWSLISGGQDCFFNYPAVPCPSATDPAIARLTFAFFGVPLVWLAGIGLAVVGRAVRRRRSAPPPT